ncbi:MAG TPA: RNA-binding S4 domain-containing protein [Solirubrobacteraceae bacterium]|nr:RNA-binding S4 domain-containing protein [Solirubrobacteraceae bacterium]
MEREISIRGEMIRLGQLLKLAGIIDTGAETKALLADEAVAVNGEVEWRRGRQLHPGDIVAVGDERLRVSSAAGER